MNDLRKIQRTQTGTFFVCLPRSWANRYGLQKGFVVSITEADDGKLLIDARYNAGQSPRTVTLKPNLYLSREIIGSYLLGFDIIRVEGKEHISIEMREIVKKTVSKLIGLEIVEEDFSSIILQCLLEPSGFPPEKIMRREYAIAAGMHRDVVSSFVAGELVLAKSVIARDNESNRLYFLLVRILRTIVQNPSLSQKLGASPIDCLDYRLAGSLVEAIGDECVRIAQTAIELEGKKLDKNLCKLFLEFQAVCFESHDNALRAFLSSEMALAEKVRSMYEEIEEKYSEIEEIARAQSLDLVPQILSVASSLRQIYGHSVDIADLAVPRKHD